MIHDSGIIAQRYAEALFNLCQKEKNLEAVEKSFDAFTNELKKNKKFVEFMESPVIPHKNKEELLSKIIPKEMPVLLVHFLKLVLTKKRFEILYIIETAFQKRSERHRSVHTAELITAVPADVALEKKLVTILEKRLAPTASGSEKASVRLVSKTNPELLGGFILKWDEQVIDASYKSKLREIKQQLYAAAI